MIEYSLLPVTILYGWATISITGFLIGDILEMEIKNAK